MKKIFAILLIAALAVTLVACGGAKNNDTDATSAPADTAAIRSVYDKAAAFVDANIDTKDLEVTEQDDDNGTYLCKFWNSTDETASADFTNDIVVDGVTITLGKTTVKELKALDGYTVDLPQDTIESDTVLGFGLSKDNKSVQLSIISNDITEAAPVDDFTIDQITCSYSDFSLPFLYSGLDEKATVKDIIEKVGMPNSTIQLTVDEQSAVIELNYSRSSKADGLTIDETLTISLNYNADNDTAAVSDVRLSRNTYSDQEES